MNTIQMISYDLQTRRIKMAMGLDPGLDVEPAMVRNMWNELNHENLKTKLSTQFGAPGSGGQLLDNSES